MSRLTPTELQEIYRYLEQGKPLPDKYRFLLFEDKREVELVWNGKTNEVTSVVLPFQIIEQVDEPRSEAPPPPASGRRGLGGGGEGSSAEPEAEGDEYGALHPPNPLPLARERKGAYQYSFDFMADARGRQAGGWTNKLIWGDNKLVLSSLKNGPMREEIERQGGIKLIYIDPPFDVGADFSMDIEIGDETFTKRPNVLEEIAYRDTWGRGADSFLAMIYERLILMRDLLAEDGSIYVHCDWRLEAHLRLALDEAFGTKSFSNSLVWTYSGWNKKLRRNFERRHDTVLFFTKSEAPIFNSYFEKWSSKEEYVRVRKQRVHTDATGREYVLSDAGSGKRIARYIDEVLAEGVVVDDVWSLDKINNSSKEQVGYPTQKPEAFIERIVLASSRPGNLVADFFCGSGTTSAVAEKLGRKWICTDLGKFAVHTTRKRMIQVQRELKKQDKPYRAFEILNMGKYERQHYVGVNPNLRDTERKQQQQAKEREFLALILRAYKAEEVAGFRTFQGQKQGRLVAVGPVNLPVTRLYVEELILECREKRVTRADVLGFEFEMGLFPSVLDDARSKGIDLAPKHIPREVFDKRAVDKGQVVFHDVAFVEVRPIVGQGTVAVELTDFSVFYSQDSIAAVEAELAEKKGASSKIVVERGQIVKLSKDARGLMAREVLTRKWSDWVDYWAVDFNFETKREIVRVRRTPSFPSGEEGAGGGEGPGMGPPQPGLETEVYEEVWTGDYVFENEWQSFRTRKDRSLELVSTAKDVPPGRRKIAVKVVDIFGNDTMKIVEVTL